MAPSLGVALAELALEGRTSAPIDGLGLDRFAGIGARFATGKRAHTTPDPDLRTKKDALPMGSRGLFSCRGQKRKGAE